MTELGSLTKKGTAFAPVAYLGLALGLALFTALIAYHGLAEVGATLAVAGSGLLAVAAFHLIPLAADAAGWRCLVADERPDWRTILRARWIGESVNGLLPVMQVGGSVVRAQLLTRRGVPAPRAAASIVVDMTTVVGTQVVFTLIGFGILLADFGDSLARLALMGMLIMALLVVAFYAAQRQGLFNTATRVFGRVARGTDWSGLTARAEAIDAEILRLYEDRRALGRAAAWHLLSWILGAGEVWLALACLGQPVDWTTALVLESLGAAVRAAAFAIPGALGVQEGGYVLLGSAVGLSPETCLALSLSKRVREIVLGVPGLIVWQLSGPFQLARVRS